ncbi:MAG: NADPH2:quinone reductase [Candidatus Azotimanducaceae bacterium]|jgi:NADPH2:quinone reductase
MSTESSQEIPSSGLQLNSLITEGGELVLSLESVAVKAPGPDQVLVRVAAAPINPSDLGLLVGPADMSTAVASGTAESPVITAKVPEQFMPAMKARVGESLPVGNEGGGVIIAAGSSDAAQAMLGKTVGILGGASYSQYRTLHVSQCLVLSDGTTPREGAACFVNPLTALAMVETMRMENHTALVHTAAASNLGQMLQKICIADGVDLVNIVRKQEQVDLLKGLGAKYVCNSSDDSFMEDLTDALVATGATIAFDATGGGKLAGQILTCMEIAANKTAKEYSRYGSDVFKQLYIYGGLDRSATTFNRNFGLSWSISGFLLTPFLAKLGGEGTQRLRQRVVDEITTTFASHYTKEVSLAEALTLDALKVYGKQATGEKYLINPTL